ncbi:hypothetical protein RB595_010213 [Gaeumannomyces hyphopodioides]
MALSAGAAVGVVLGVLGLAFVLALGFRILWVIYMLRQPLPSGCEHLYHDTEADKHARRAFGSYMSDLTPGGSQHIQHLRNAFVDHVASFISNHLNTLGYIQGKRSIDLAKFTDAAGYLEDWKLLNEHEGMVDWGKVEEVLRHFICRVLGERIRPDGDPKITLLPPDLLQLYQRFAKVPPSEIQNNPDNRYHSDNIPTIMLHHWRALGGSFAVPRTINRKDATINPPRFLDDDSRLPAIAATQELLFTLLAPMDKSLEGNPCPLDGYTEGMRSESGRASFMDLMVGVTELGLAMFSSPRPMDIFWPENREEHEGLVCFGITSTNIVPGSYSDRDHGLVHRQLFLRPYDKLCQEWRQKERAVAVQQWKLKAAQLAKKDDYAPKPYRTMKRELAESRMSLARARVALAGANKSDEVEVAAAEAEEKRVAAEAEAVAEADKAERERVLEEKRQERRESWERRAQARLEDPGVEGSGAGGAGVVGAEAV